MITDINQTKGLLGNFLSPIAGDERVYQVRIYFDLVNGELEGMNLLDYNEDYQFWGCDKPNKLGITGVIVKVRKLDKKAS